jgi:alpha-1,6-mannosyltransferase
VRIVRIANYVSPRSGGMRTALRELGAGYLAAGHEPVLIVPGPADSDSQTPHGRVITLRGPVLPVTGGYRAMLRRRRIQALLTTLKPDRLEVSDRTTLRWTGRWAREHGVPSVMVSHESLTALLGGPFRGQHSPARLVADTLNRRTARQYDQVICTTAWAAAEFERLGAGNLKTIPLGVDLGRFSPSGYDPAVRAEYAAPDEVLLVHCGRLSVEKKPGLSLAALRDLRISGIPAVLVVAGDGPLRRRLERQVARWMLPVRFEGFISDTARLATLLATADAVLAPGPAETFGLAALEALACATPVVVNVASALPEVAGRAGVAVAGKHFAAGVRTVLSWPEARRREAARARACEFGWATAVEGFLDVHNAADIHNAATGLEQA